MKDEDRTTSPSGEDRGADGPGELPVGHEREETSTERAADRYGRLIENLREGLFVYSHDTDGVFSYVSPSVTDILGYTREEFLTHHQEYETDSPINRGTERHTRLSIRGIQQPAYEVEIFHKDGSVKRLEVREVPIFDDEGEVVAVEGIALDVTDKRRIEEELRQFQKMKAIGQLAGGIAHEYNNMLTGIIGRAELSLEEVAPDSRVAEDLRGIRDVAVRAAGLTRQLLAFSRRQPLAYEELDLNDLIEGRRQMIRRVIGGEVDLVLGLDPDIPPVMADPFQIEQVLVNLALNARDSMPEGGRLTLSTGVLILGEDDRAVFPELASGSYARVRVADTGVGIPAEVRERIFEPFFTTKDVTQASGLGLSMSYGIVKQHGGHMTISSGSGAGTTVEFVLPSAERVEASEAPSVRRPSSATEASATVLVVEDEALVLTIVRRTLEAKGYRVLAAEGPGAAKALFARRGDEVDLLLTDVVMPDQTGPQLYRELSGIRPDLKVVFMSGYTRRTSAEAGVVERGAHFLAKPFAADELVGIVREALEE